MEAKVENILKKIELHQFSNNILDDGSIDSWGLGFSLNRDIDLSVFDNIHAIFSDKVKRAQEEMHESNDISPESQFVLNHEGDDWIISFECYNPKCQLNSQYSMIITINKEQARKILTMVFDCGIRIYDHSCQDILI